MHLTHRAIWIWFLLLSLIYACGLESLAKNATQSRSQAPSRPLHAKDAFVDVSVDYGAQLTLTDSQGRITGYDPTTGKTLSGIPDSSYGDDSISDATDNSPNGATAESRVLEIHPQTAGQYSLKVFATDRNSYSIQFFCSAGKGRSANVSVHDLGITTHEMHGFNLAVAPDCSGNLVSGAFYEHNGSNPPLLTYAYPIADHVHLNSGDSFRAVIVYDGQIRSSSFSATLNGNTISNFFHPSPNAIEAVAIPLKAGHNLIQFNVTGTSEHGSTLIHTDSFVVDVD